MKAFNGSEQLKTDLLAEVIKHRKADQIIKGTYCKSLKEGQKFRACAVGCSLHSYSIISDIDLDVSNHKNYELFGIPMLLARLEDVIFEGLPEVHYEKWPEQFLKAINVGADLSTVWPKFAVWLMIDKKYGVLQYARNHKQKEAIKMVAYLYKNNGSIDDFKKAKAAALACYSSAAAFAAYAAAATFDYTSAYAAATSASYAATAADSTAYAATSAAATYDTRYKARIAQSKKLLSLMRACK